MTKVYVLIYDDYSGHETIGAFTSREGAEEARAGNRGSEIEELVLDELAGHLTGPVWDVVISKVDGEATYSRKRKDFRHPEAVDVTDTEDRIWVESPISAEHALKVAVEKRQEWLRTNDPAALLIKIRQREYKRLQEREAKRRQEWHDFLEKRGRRPPHPEPAGNWMDGYLCPPRPDDLPEPPL